MTVKTKEQLLKYYKEKKPNEDKLWKVFSVFIRLRDAKLYNKKGYVKCISCNTVKHWKEMEAGHYIAKGSSYALKYEEKNVNAQCKSCNNFKSGNLINYRINLVIKWGENIVNNLEMRYQMKEQKKKMSKFEVDILTKYYKKEIKKYE